MRHDGKQLPRKLMGMQMFAYVYVWPACYTHSVHDIWPVNAGRRHDSSRSLTSPAPQTACNQ